MEYRKHFVPLESNPDVFNELASLLGVSDRLHFEDVFSLVDPHLLPHPAVAVILVLPTTREYEARKAEVEASREEYAGNTTSEEVFWVKQTINNACGLYALIHAVMNSGVDGAVEPASLLKTLTEQCVRLQPAERADLLESSAELEHAYAQVAAKGDSAAPSDPTVDVDFHYICFARPRSGGRMFELDGDSKGPKATGVSLNAGDDLLSDAALGHIRQMIEREQQSAQFSMMALVLGD